MNYGGIIIARANKTDMVVRKFLPKHSLSIPAFVVILIGIASSLAWIQVRENQPMPNVIAAVEPSAFMKTETFNGHLVLAPAELFF